MPGGGVVANDAGDVLVATRSCSLEDQDRWTIPSWTRSAVRRPRCSSTSVESFARGRLSRREFIKRGTIVGLSMASISAVIAACGGTTTSPSASSAGGAARRRRPAPAAAAGSPTHRRHDPDRLPASRGPARPGRDDRPRRATASPPSRSSSCARSAPNATDIAPGLARAGRRTTTTRVWTFKLRQGVKWQDGTDFTSADVVATMERLVAAGNSGLKGVIDEGLRRRHRPEHGDVQPGQRQRQLPVPRVGLQRPVADHAGRLRRRARRSTRRPNGTGAWKIVEQLRHRDRASSSSATTPGGAARRRSTAREFTFFDDTGLDGHRLPGRPDRRPRPVRRPVGRAALQRPELHGRRYADHQPPPDLDAHATPASSPTSGSARRSPSRSIDRRSSSSCSRARAISANDHVIWQFYPYFSDTVAAAGPGHRRRPSSSWPTPATPACQRDAPVRPAQRDPGPRRAHPEPGRRRPGSRSPRPVRTTARSTTPSGATRPSRPTRRAPATPSSASSTTATARARTSSSTRPTRRTASGTRRSTRHPAFDAAFTEFQAAVGVDAQKAACAKIEQIMQRRHAGRDPVLLQLPVRQLEEVHRRLHVRARPDVPVGRLEPSSHIARERPVAGRSRSASIEPGR